MLALTRSLLRPTTFRALSTFPPLRQEEPEAPERYSDDFDVVIVGGGPAGLSAALRLTQLCEEHSSPLRIVLVEKGAEIGSHILSGMVLEPRALDELLPTWREMDSPIKTAATKEGFKYLLGGAAIPLPTLPAMHNEGNYVGSLGDMCRWMGGLVEEAGVEVYPGIGISSGVFNEQGVLCGVRASDVGLSKEGEKKDSFELGMELRGRLTILAEGCRGSLSKEVMNRYNLSADADPQKYGIGIKEVWKLAPENHVPGSIIHTAGKPMDWSTYGGSFLYHFTSSEGEPLASVGYVVGLDYTNPYLTPYDMFQEWKTHPLVAKQLKGGECISYGARALIEGGLQCLPKLHFPGGVLVGDAAGTMNTIKIKGVHTAMKSGMLAAEAAFEKLRGSSVAESSELEGVGELEEYSKLFKSSWVHDELHLIRNIRPAFEKFWGFPGLSVFGVLDSYLLKGRSPTIHFTESDNETLKSAKQSKPIKYKKPDNELTFDLLTNLIRSGTNHNEDQPSHLTLKDDTVPVKVNLALFDGPESRYCPAKVYEFITGEDGAPKLQINAPNCLHCKTCDIKDPTQNINWVVPEGGGGPLYGSM